MKLRDLDYICAVAKHRHFGQAAEACHVSQPTLSGQIKKLETYLGVILFERSNKSVRVTEAGHEIVAIAKEAQDAVTRIKTVAEAAKDPLAGSLSLGLIPTIAPYLIPLFVGKMQKHMPKLSMSYREDITERLTADLLSGDIHAAILATPPETDTLVAIPLYSEPFWIMFPKTHALNTAETISMNDVTADEILLLTEGHCFRDQALSICQVRGENLRQSLRATSLETLINLVAAHQGVTLVPALALRAGLTMDSHLSAVKLADKNAERTIYLTYRKRFPRRVAVERLGQLIKDGLPDTVTVL